MLGVLRSAYDSQDERKARRDPAGMMATATGDHRPDTSLRQAAWTAATSLLVMSVLSPIGFFYVFPRLISRTSIAQTVQNIGAHQGLFLAGIFCYLITFICDVVVAWGLFVFLRPVQASLSVLTAWFRLIYAAMALVASLKLVTVLRLVRSPDYATAFGAAPLQAQVQLLLSSFRYEWGFSMVVFAGHLLLLSVLVYRSGYVPKLLGVMLAINGVAYLVDSLRPYLFPTAQLPFLFVLFFGELIFMLWLFVWGTRIRQPVIHRRPA